MKNLLLISSLVLLFGCSKEKSSRIGYTVLCDCKGKGLNITYSDENGNIVSETVKEDEWRKEFMSTGVNHFYVAGQSKANEVEIAARIYKDGSIVKSQTISGDLVFAVAEIDIPD